ncbi:MAG TPA: hypothetical protein VGL60_02200 [Acidimicrobiales bacterium]
MADGFDSELYLRLAGERAVLDPAAQQGPAGLTLSEIAGALAAIGAIDGGVARQIVADYHQALALRGLGHLPTFPPRPSPASRPAVPLVAARVARCECTFERQGIEVTTQYACLTPDAASVAVILREITSGALLGSPGRPPGLLPFTVRLADDRGAASLANFSGGGFRSSYHGELTTTQPLALDTRSIEIDGHRVDLCDQPALPPVRVEELRCSNPAERYLWSRMSAGRHGPHGGPVPPQIDIAIDTLVAAGALSRDDPLIDELRAVLGAFSAQPLTTPVRQPWQSLLHSQHRRSSRSCIVPLGIVTPALSGLTICFDALVITGGDVEAHVRTSSSENRGGQPPEPREAPQVGWWAADELGNHYLGAATRVSRGSGGFRGVISLWPSLDDRAETLRLLPTVNAERAVIEVPLSDERAAR